MATIASMDVRIGAHTAELQAGMKRAEAIVSQSVSKIAKMGKFAVKMFAGIGGIAGLGAGAGFTMMGRRAIGLAANLEVTQLAFETLTGSVEGARKHLKELSDMAADTPFSIKDFRAASQSMHALGFETEKVIPMLKAVGDAVAAVGGGSAEIDGVVTALSFMKSQGQVTSREMLMIARKGIPIWEMMADKLGTDVTGAMEMVRKGIVSADTALEAFREGSHKRFGGLMDRASAETLLGAWGTFKANMELIFEPLGTRLIAALKLKEMTDKLVNFTKTFRQTLESSGLEAAMAKIIGPDTANRLMKAFDNLREIAVPALKSLGKTILDMAINALPKVVLSLNFWLEFFETLPARGKIAFHWLTSQLHSFVNQALIGLRDLYTAMDSPVLQNLFGIDVEQQISNLNNQIAAHATMFMDSRRKMVDAQKELQGVLDLQEQRRQARDRPVTDEMGGIEGMMAAAEAATQSIISIKNAAGEELATGLAEYMVQGATRGGDGFKTQLRKDLDEVQAGLDRNPITVKLRYEAIGTLPPGVSVTMPAS